MRIDADEIAAAVPVEIDESDGWRGVRDARVDPDVIGAALAAHESGRGEVLKRDARSLVTATRTGDLAVIVKEVRKSGARRRLADCFRGAPATRAFRAGRGLIERGIGAALPLAAVERRRLGVPVRSLLVSLDLRGDPTAAALLASRPERRSEALAALAELLIRLHRSATVHGDLRAGHTHLCVGTDESLVAKLIDLESVRFGRTPDDDARLDDWAQMNGSIPDEHASTSARRAAFDRYANALPFAAGAQAAFEEMTRRSIRRTHLFLGSSGDRAATDES